jgi:hypothetical protein
MPTADEAIELLEDSVLKIDEELAKNPSAERKQELETSRETLMAQIDNIDAVGLSAVAAAVKASADALQTVVLSGSTDPLAIVVRRLRQAAKSA